MRRLGDLILDLEVLEAYAVIFFASSLPISYTYSGIPLLSLRPVHCGYYDGQGQLRLGGADSRTHKLSHGLVLAYVDIFVKCVEFRLPPPNLRLLELSVGFLRNEFSRSQESACGASAG